MSSYWRSRPPYSDLAAVSEKTASSGGERWRITKSHAQFEEQAAAHARLAAQQRALLDGLVPCLQLLLPGAGGGRSAGSSGGMSPPAKAARSC